MPGLAAVEGAGSKHVLVLHCRVARLRNGRLVPLEGAGHYPMVERPDQTVRLWEEALGKGAAHA